MPIKTIEFNGVSYPKFQAEGNAALWVREFALRICNPMRDAIGFDIGCNREEWKLPCSIAIDPVLKCSLCEENKLHTHYDAYNLPNNASEIASFEYDLSQVDYIFSSHCLEHLPNWVKALDYWHSRLKPGGVMFLYLPDMDTQIYWRMWHNQKHVHYLTPDILHTYFMDNSHMWCKVFVSGVDLNNSFIAMAEKI